MSTGATFSPCNGRPFPTPLTATVARAAGGTGLRLPCERATEAGVGVGGCPPHLSFSSRTSTNTQNAPHKPRNGIYGVPSTCQVTQCQAWHTASRLKTERNMAALGTSFHAAAPKTQAFGRPLGAAEAAAPQTTGWRGPEPEPCRLPH